MLDIGWSEMLIVGVVALIVVGPKDLPKMFHTLGQVTGKARGMAREFQRAMDVAAKEAGVGTIAKDLRNLTSGRTIKDAVGFDSIEKEFRDIGRGISDVGQSPKAKMMPKAAGTKPDSGKAQPQDDFDDEEIDEIEVRDHDDDLAARNAALSAVEEQRLIRAKKISQARLQAADIRARREAAEAEAAAAEQPRDWRPQTAAAPKTATPETATPKPARARKSTAAAEPQPTPAQPTEDS